MQLQVSPRPRLKTLVDRLALCTLVLAGAAGWATQASAAVVTSTTPIVVPNTIDGVYINLVTGATGTSAISGFDFNPYGTSTLLFYWGGTTSPNNGGAAASATGPYLDLSAGDVVGPASTFIQVANGSLNETSAFLTTGIHELGIRFTNESTGAINYGYVTISTTASSGFPATVLGWSYDNTGAAITVSAVPEASTLWMMALGGLAIGAQQLRRRRQGETG